MVEHEADLTATRRYEPVVETAAAGRRFLRDTAAGSGVDLEALVQAGSELITNAIRHAQTPFTVEVSINDSRVCVAVTDYSAAPPVVRPLSPDGDGGRGMHLVALLASAWGTEQLASGKTVWFEMRIGLGQGS